MSKTFDNFMDLSHYGQPCMKFLLEVRSAQKLKWLSFENW